MLKKIISISLIIILAFGSLTTAFAATKFGDVDENRYSWAIKDIEEMAEKGIISGYPDGTFKPEKQIIKVEAMLLIARILGFYNDVYEEKLEEIYALYEDDLNPLSLQYKNEIAFLIYKNVFSLEEIEEIANGDEFSETLLRYEAAEYITRALGAYGSVSDKNTGYADESKIPSYARAYVKFVKDKGIMLGMSESEFAPDFEVNRVQMAAMLYRTMNLQNLMFVGAEYEKISSNEIVVKLDSVDGKYDIAETEFFINGETAKSSDFIKGSDIVLVFENGVLKRAELMVEVYDAANYVTGEIKEANIGANSKIKIEDSTTGNKVTYELPSSCQVLVDGANSTLSGLRVKDFVKLYIDKKGEVFKVEILDVNAQFKDGLIKEVQTDEDVVIAIERDNGDKEEYRVSEDVIVKRNSQEAELKDILPGDKVSVCYTKYNKITRIEVKSEIGNAKGKIAEIVISKNPSIVIVEDGEEIRYPVNSSVVIKVEGKTATIYDLRMDMTATIKTDSGTVKEISVSTVEEAGQISGEIELVNASYGFINVKLSSGETKQIFVSNSTKITADGAVTATKTIRNLKAGDLVVVIGKTVNGAFNATTIVVLDK